MGQSGVVLEIVFLQLFFPQGQGVEEDTADDHTHNEGEETFGGELAKGDYFVGKYSPHINYN